MAARGLGGLGAAPPTVGAWQVPNFGLRRRRRKTARIDTDHHGSGRPRVPLQILLATGRHASAVVR